MRCQASYTALFCEGFHHTAGVYSGKWGKKGPAGVKTEGQKQPVALWEKFVMIYDFLTDESSVCCVPHVDTTVSNPNPNLFILGLWHIQPYVTKS